MVCRNDVTVTLCTVCVTVALLTMASVAIVISCMEPAESHSARTLLSQFIGETRMSLRGRHVLGRLRHASKHLTATQTSVLLSILKRNAQTTYGRRHRFTDVLEAASTEGVEATRRLYVSIVPLSTYDHYIDDIRQLFDSEDAPAAGILTVDRVEFFSYSSGTTGKYKIVPGTQSYKVSIP